MIGGATCFISFLVLCCFVVILLVVISLLKSPIWLFYFVLEEIKPKWKIYHLQTSVVEVKRRPLRIVLIT